MDGTDFDLIPVAFSSIQDIGCCGSAVTEIVDS
jgi:hypothetical protein